LPAFRCGSKFSSLCAFQGEAQKWRARDQVKWAAVRAYCSTVVSDALSSYTMTKIAEDLLDKGKHKITYRAIGYSEEVALEVERR
jgi:hypothetical protein